MTTELMNPKDFQAHMVDRLREDVGKLIPDEKLATLVEEAIQKMFFTRIKAEGYNGRETPSWWEREVEAQLKERASAFTRAYFETNRETLEKSMSEALITGLPNLLASVVMSAISNSTQNAGFSFGQTVGDSFVTALRNKGIY